MTRSFSRPGGRIRLTFALLLVGGLLGGAGALAGVWVARAAAGPVITAAVLAAVALGGLAGALFGGRIEEAIRGVRDGLAGRGPLPGRSSFAEVQDLARAARSRLQEDERRYDRLARERADLSALLAAAGEGILLVREGAVITRANPAAHRFLGLSDDAEGAHVDSSIRATAIRQAIHGALDRGEAAAVEHELDGRRVFVMAQPVPEHGAVVSIVDLTEIRRLETARRDFVANASHELKTPLTSIRGYAETLQDPDLPPDTRARFLETIRANAERLQRVVDDLLDLSRIEAGAWKPHLEPVDVAEAATEAWAGVETAASERAVRLDALPAPGVRVLADSFALRQILANLLDNALRHSGPDTGIQVTTDAVDGSRRSGTGGPEARSSMVRIAVTDSGAGIPSEALPRIFERFYRVDSARTGDAGAGTGLGLAIVRHLTEQMGGSVTAESVLGRGTTVSVTLPAATDVRRPSSPPTPHPARSGGGPSLPAAALRRSGLSPFG